MSDEVQTTPEDLVDKTGLFAGMNKIMAIASMVLGSFAAIMQSNIKRLMAYSSIGHVGFALLGLIAGNDDGLRGVMIYMAIYLLMNVGMFVCIMSMRRKEQGMVEDIN